MSNVIRFTASVNKVQTMVDGGLRVVLDFDETEVQTAAELMKVKQAGGVLEIAAVARVEQSHTNGQTKVNERSTRNPINVD